MIEALSPRLRPADEGGARVVAVGTRDWLGWPSRPLLAASAAALVATVRRLALAQGHSGITVNAVVAIPPNDGPLRNSGEVPGTCTSRFR